MSKLKVSSREIGTVRVFDLEGVPTQEDLDLISWKIQRHIRRHRLQRIILNLQRIPSLDYLGVRKLLSACLRPQQSLIYGASRDVRTMMESSYIPRNVRICDSEVEVAEDLGPFLMDKSPHKEMPAKELASGQMSTGFQIERRRSKRMHVALPLHLAIAAPDGSVIESEAIATNISEGGLFAEYLDLEATHKIEALEEPMNGLKAQIVIHSSANFPDEFRVTGAVRRKELRKKQLGIAIEFIA